jgi:hypothetical protein
MIDVKKGCTTRRKFCRRLAEVAVSGVFVGLEATASPYPQPGAKAVVETDYGEAAGNGEHLVAVCGTYCGACPMCINTQPGSERRRKEMFEQFASGPMKMRLEDLVCDGCLSKGRIAPHCQKCGMRSCAADKSDVTRCSDCPDFPCSRITDFSNDGRLHHAELLHNLRNIRKMGIKDWTKHEQERWKCPECRNSISWYDKACSNCGAKRSERLFALRKD